MPTQITPSTSVTTIKREVQTYYGRKHQKARRKDRSGALVLSDSDEAPTPIDMKTVSAVCTAHGLNFDDLRKYLSSKFTSFTQVDEAFHISYDQGEIFFLEEGTVFWNIDAAFQEKILDDTKAFRLKTFRNVEEEKMLYACNVENMDSSRIIKDHLYLASKNPEQARFEKFMVSSAMAKCAYLSQWEQEVDDLVDVTRRIPEDLEKGTHPMKQRDVNVLLGRLLRIRGEINLHSNLAETPGSAWEKSELENLYNNTARHFDLFKSLKEVNLKLENVKDVMELIRQQSAESHTSKLEWFIIILILAEVFFQIEGRGFFIDYWFNYGRGPFGPPH